jgi:hypothetical protein
MSIAILFADPPQQKSLWAVFALLAGCFTVTVASCRRDPIPE